MIPVWSYSRSSTSYISFSGLGSCREVVQEAGGAQREVRGQAHASGTRKIHKLFCRATHDL